MIKLEIYIKLLKARASISHNI